MSFIYNNVALSGITILISFVILFGMAIKGKNLLVCALFASLVAAFACPDGFIAGLSTTFISGGNSLFSMLFLVMLSGAFLSVVMERTGVAQRIGDTIAGSANKRTIVIALLAYAILLGFLGISISMFIFYAVAIPICQRANISKSIPLMIYLGTTATLGAGWGVPMANNLMLTKAFGTSLYDAPFLGITTLVLGLAMLVYICLRELKKSGERGEGFVREGEGKGLVKALDPRPKEELPSLFMSVLPCILLIAGVPILQNVVGFDASGSAIITQLIVGIFMILTNWNRFVGNKIDAIYESLSSPIPILISAFAMSGYGAIVSSSLFYTSATDALMGTGISGYVMLVIVVMFVCGFTGDCVSGLLMVTSSIGPTLLEAGYNPAVLHRLTALTVQTFDSLPHSYMVAVNLQLYGHTLKSGYKYAFRTTVVMTVICALVGLAIALCFY